MKSNSSFLDTHLKMMYFATYFKDNQTRLLKKSPGVAEITTIQLEGKFERTKTNGDWCKAIAPPTYGTRLRGHYKLYSNNLILLK